MKLCYVYCRALTADQLGYSAQFPILLRQVLGDCATIYAFYSGVVNEDDLRINGVIPISIQSNLMNKGIILRFIALIYYIFKIGRTYQIDIFMNVWSHYLMLPIWIGAKFCGCQAIACIGGVPIKKGFGQKPKSLTNRFIKAMGLLLERFSLRVVPKVSAVSYSLKSEFTSRGVPANKIQVISRGIDTEAFQMNPYSQKNKSDKVYHIGTASRLVQQKDIETIIEAFSILSKKYSSVYLHIAGVGDHKSELMNVVRDRGLSDKVFFRGYLRHEELLAFYADIDLFVLASLSEGVANVILEALACGLPVVSTNVGDIPIHLDQGRGHMFKIGDYRRLANIVENIYLSRRDSAAIRRRRRDYVLENHSLSQLREQYLSLYHSVMNNGFQLRR